MLCIKSVANENEVYPLKGFKFSIGSAPECDIVLEHGMLHDIHALLWVGKDFVTVMTVQDAVVTVNGELVTDRRKVQIGETIAFADQEMRVDEISEEAPKKTAKAKKPEKAEEPESEWMLISRNPEMKGQKIKIEERCTVGRAKDNTICIPMISLSRHHATLNLDEEGLTVKDEQSANGTFINGKQIGAEPTRLQRGDIVAFDELEFLVHGPESSIYSEQTSVRAVARPNFASRSPVPTAIDRQKISIVQRKPESFTEKFEAIQAEQSFGNRAGKFLSSPVFWLGIVAVIIIAAAVTTASAQDFLL